jgi:succinate-semialdehyde dehydrogenase/glutarate-semialdehyde dehydrogenase
LAVGCTQVIKPANETPLSAIALCELAVEAGVPDGVVNLVTAPGPVAGRALLGDRRVRKLSFTGSTEVGQELVRMSADHLTRLSLELGGHAPVIVLDDAEIGVAVEQAVRAKFRNNGQSCIAANRFYVARAIADDFTAAFVTAVEKLSVGRWDQDPDVGPLIDDRAVVKVRSHVDDAVERGATLRCGGEVTAAGPGTAQRFFQPTVLADVTDDMLISTEETFGPIAGISVFDTDDEAIRRANDSPYGLAAYVFGRNLSRVLRTVERLDYGVIGVNDGVPSTAQAPFGGMKMSGTGREGGHYVMREYLETKYVSLNLGQ